MKKSEFLPILFLFALCSINCNSEKSADTPGILETNSIIDSINQSAINDDQEFQVLFKKFKQALAGKNINTASTMLHFPFFTSYGQQETGMGAANNPISNKEFATYSTVIFNPNVLQLLPKCKEENLSEIDEKTTEIYYKSLEKYTDLGSKMYEVYFQYPEMNTNAESFFGFVFGKVNGKFKAMAVYTKWPIKG